MLKTLVDLTHTIEEGMTTFDAHWHPFVSIKQLGRLGFEGRETREITFGTHTGTHVDAPLHFIEHGNSIDNIPLEKLVGQVTIIDLSFLGSNGVVTSDIIPKEKISKKMIFKFGWEKFWGKKEFYLNYPYFSANCAEYLVSCGVELIGYDTPSPDDSRIKLGTVEDSMIHKIFLKNNIILVEYLANLNTVKNYDNWNISVSPLKLKDADGSPARVFLFR